VEALQIEKLRERKVFEEREPRIYPGQPSPP
jgi:hypothetical protein